MRRPPVAVPGPALMRGRAHPDARGLALVGLLALLSGPGAAGHADVMAFSQGSALAISLEDFDGCVLGPDGPVAFAAMTPMCRALLEGCPSRMHLDDVAGLRDFGARMLLERCLREDSGRFHVLWLRHATAVLERLPADATPVQRAAAVERFVDRPEREAAEAGADCLRAAADDTARLMCARDRRLDQLTRARAALREERR